SGNWSSGTVAPGASQQVRVTFTPTSAKAFGGSVTVAADQTSGSPAIAASGRTGTLVWRNRATGENLMGMLMGSAIVDAAPLPTVADLNWEIKAQGDFDGDGFIDLLWRNRVTGDNIVWLMKGAVLGAAAFVPAVPDLDWQLAGVADFDGDGRA